MSARKKCYVTTPIYYASGNVQLGNSYTTVACDVFARYNRAMNRDTYFLTGMDEHGQKIEEAAKNLGRSPQEHTDIIAEETKGTWESLKINYDGFIRTTDKVHVEVVQQVFEKFLAQDDIYLGKYTGNYCVGCETFFTKTQLNGENVCPDCGKPIRVVEEESYFFRLKKYEKRLLKYIEEHPDFIQPETRKNEVVSFIESGLEDLCVSRTSFSWGIPINSNPKHVIYVWLDALFNYVTALGYGTPNDELYQKYWVNNEDFIYHVVGKDILRFHAIFWPIFLMALDVPMNFKLMVHGWILNRDGKMSKSRGNAVYPADVIGRYGVDATRYYLAKELPLGNDGLFTYDRFIERYNNELVNDLGNLLRRSVAMVNKYFDGEVENNPNVSTEFDESLKETALKAIEETKKCFDGFRLQNGIEATWMLVSRANKYIDETAPWTLAKEGSTGKLKNVMYHLLESLRVIANLVSPYLVESAPKMLKSLGIENYQIDIENLSFGTFKGYTKVVEVDALFNRLDAAKELASIAEEQKKKEEKTKVVVEEKTTNEISIEDFAKIELKVGEIIAAQKHENAQNLLVLQVKIGDETRQIVSGIAKFYDPQNIIGKKIVVVTNLKPAVIRGVESKGMILCAVENAKQKDEKLEILEVKELSNKAIVR